MLRSVGGSSLSDSVGPRDGVGMRVSARRAARAGSVRRSGGRGGEEGRGGQNGHAWVRYAFDRRVLQEAHLRLGWPHPPPARAANCTYPVRHSRGYFSWQECRWALQANHFLAGEGRLCWRPPATGCWFPRQSPLLRLPFPGIQESLPSCIDLTVASLATDWPDGACAGEHGRGLLHFASHLTEGARERERASVY